MRSETDPGGTGMQAGAAALGAEGGQDRPVPDPEIVAKPIRRQFTAEYRLRVLEEADRCTRPGEVGRLLRREGARRSGKTARRVLKEPGTSRYLRSAPGPRRRT